MTVFARSKRQRKKGPVYMKKSPVPGLVIKEGHSALSSLYIGKMLTPALLPESTALSLHML